MPCSVIRNTADVSKQSRLLLLLLRILHDEFRVAVKEGGKEFVTTLNWCSEVCVRGWPASSWLSWGADWNGAGLGLQLGGRQLGLQSAYTFDCVVEWGLRNQVMG